MSVSERWIIEVLCIELQRTCSWAHNTIEINAHGASQGKTKEACIRTAIYSIISKQK